MSPSNCLMQQVILCFVLFLIRFVVVKMPQHVWMVFMASQATLKEHFSQVNSNLVLRKIKILPLLSWMWKLTAAYYSHTLSSASHPLLLKILLKSLPTGFSLLAHFQAYVSRFKCGNNCLFVQTLNKLRFSECWIKQLHSILVAVAKLQNTHSLSRSGWPLLVHWQFGIATCMANIPGKY